jgi:hypothetical protein
LVHDRRERNRDEVRRDDVLAKLPCTDWSSSASFLVGVGVVCWFFKREDRRVPPLLATLVAPPPVPGADPTDGASTVLSRLLGVEANDASSVSTSRFGGLTALPLRVDDTAGELGLESAGDDEVRVVRRRFSGT